MCRLQFCWFGPFAATTQPVENSESLMLMTTKEFVAAEKKILSEQADHGERPWVAWSAEYRAARIKSLTERAVGKLSGSLLRSTCLPKLPGGCSVENLRRTSSSYHVKQTYDHRKIIQDSIAHIGGFRFCISTLVSASVGSEHNGDAVWKLLKEGLPDVPRRRW